MKYINRFNESFTVSGGELPHRDLQDEINKYNDTLIDDDIWKNHYHRIDRYDLKREDRNFLESIIEFAKNRLRDIKKENDEYVADLKAVFNVFEDECDKFVDSITCHQNSNSLKLELHFNITFTKRLIKDRKLLDLGFKFQADEVIEFWPHVISTVTAINNMGLNVKIGYSPNMSEIVFYIKYI